MSVGKTPLLLSLVITHYAYVGLSANETVGDETGEMVEPARPDEEDEEDNADGRGDFILMLFESNSFGGGLITIWASGMQNVVNF